jgi:NAD(P)H dehydrogenase (quinone)
MQHGMIWVGAAGEAGFEPPSETPSAADKLTGEMLGRRVAMLAQRIHSNKPA